MREPDKEENRVITQEASVDEETDRILEDMAAFYEIYQWEKSADKSVSVEPDEGVGRCSEGCPDLFEEIAYFVDLYGGGRRIVVMANLKERFMALASHFPGAIRIERYRGHYGKHLVVFDPRFENAFGQTALTPVEQLMFEEKRKEYENLSTERDLGVKLAEVFGREKDQD